MREKSRIQFSIVDCPSFSKLTCLRAKISKFAESTLYTLELPPLPIVSKTIYLSAIKPKEETEQRGERREERENNSKVKKEMTKNDTVYH